MKVHQRGVNAAEPLEYLPMTAGTAYVLGAALNLASGGAVLTTARPAYICAGQAVGVAGGRIPAFRVLEDMVLEAPLRAAGTGLKVGDKVTIAADAVGVTATTTAGVAEITGFATEERAVGDGVFIRFA